MEPQFNAPPNWNSPGSVEAGQPAPERQITQGEMVSPQPATSPVTASAPLPAPLPPPAAPTQPAPVPPAMTSTTSTASDGDVIEKAWVDKAKQILGQTKGDPYGKTQAISQVKADYIRSRYGKEIKVSGE